MKSHQLARLMAGVCAAAAAFGGASARAQDADSGHWTFTIGADYTRGDYGEAVDTTIYQVPFGAGYTSDRFSVSVSVPYVHLKGSGDIIPGSVSAFGPGSTGGASAGTGGVSCAIGSGLSPRGGLVNVILPSPPMASPPPPPGSPPPPTVIEHEGIGDTTLSASYAPFISDSGARFTIATDFRFPTGDDKKALGAGQTIGSVSTSYAFPIAAHTALYGAVGYQDAFDTNTSGGSAAVGGETRVGESSVVGATVSWAQAVINGVPNQSEATLYGGVDLSAHTRLAAYALAGLSRTSPDNRFGVRLVFK